jgi:riboflavin synthase
VFTGIVSGIGRVATVERRRGKATRVVVVPPQGYGAFRRGESVAVSGVCVTATESGRRLVADLSPETLAVTTLGAVEPDGTVNLERALQWRGRVSGHFVLGHVDAVAQVLDVEDAGGSWTFRFSIPRGFSPHVVRKGSVALDGVSLTVARRGARAFEVAVIPETYRRTTLGSRRAGDRVNFEVDPLSRYRAAGRRRSR